MLRGISMDSVDSPDQLKRIMASQYGDQLPDHEQMDIGYFHKTNKVCIKSRLDINDVWGLIRKGEKVTLWCIGALNKGQSESHKRPSEEAPHSAKKVKKGMTAEDKRAAALEFEEKLLAKHPDKYSRYQIRFWAEMLANGGYSDLDTPSLVPSPFLHPRKRVWGIVFIQRVTMECMTCSIMHAYARGNH